MKSKNILFFTLLLGSCIVLSFTMSTNPTERFLEIAKEYRQYRQFKDIKTAVTDSSKYKWTIALCIRLQNQDGGFHTKEDSTFFSKADQTISLHGNKLYRLFIKDYASYIQNRPAGQPLGQVIVKETWNVKEISFDSLNTTVQQIRSQNDGKWYTPTTASELFIMYKEKAKPGNDKGWNYGTYSLENPNEKPLLLNDAKLSSCIGCHQKTKYDRIFGVK